MVTYTCKFILKKSTCTDGFKNNTIIHKKSHQILLKIFSLNIYQESYQESREILKTKSLQCNLNRFTEVSYARCSSFPVYSSCFNKSGEITGLCFCPDWLHRVHLAITMSYTSREVLDISSMQNHNTHYRRIYLRWHYGFRTWNLFCIPRSVLSTPTYPGL